jgi:hypothetical protein
MGGVEVPRPLTHDLAVSLLKALSAILLRIEINDLQEGTFYARLVLRQEGEDIVVDARPSDAIGIAVRTGCPVFISEAVVDEAGISVNLVTEADRSVDESAVDGTGEEAGSSEGSEGASGEEEDIDEADGNGDGAGPGELTQNGRPPRAGKGGLSRLDGVDLPESIAQGEEARLLREELEEAIAVEDYERAAFLRDRIRSLGG